jgi:uncharacterized protein YndB with AHSA1/START domain
MMTTTVEPVRKTLELGCDPETAFRTFTDGIDAWWPLADYSVGGKDAARAVFEARAGGRIYEVSATGAESDWGEVVVCEPPGRLVFTWHPAGNASNPTEIEVRFVATDRGTRLELEHRNWDRLGEKAASTREGYDRGWVAVLAAYVRAAGG